MRNLAVKLMKFYLIHSPKSKFESVCRLTDFRVKGTKNEAGEMQLVIHQHNPNDDYWTYTKYVLYKSGSLTEIWRGQYPTFFVR